MLLAATALTSAIATCLIAPGTSDIPRDHEVVVRSVLGGLHHEYLLERIAA